MLSDNEVRNSAYRFSKEHKNDGYERGEAQTFLTELLAAIGLSRRDVTTFERRVKLWNCKGEDDRDGYIDMLWPGNLMVEMKSAGKDLDDAFIQASTYLRALKDSVKPRYILCCDFQHFDFYDLDHEEALKTSFPLEALADDVHLFDVLRGKARRDAQEQIPLNAQAAELLGKVHDALKETGYSGHSLEVYLVRLLFLMFADDTGIFPKDALWNYIADRTQENGSDPGSQLSYLFEILDEPESERPTNLDADLRRFPYINGGLFSGRIRTPSFDSRLRDLILQCCRIDWSRISPAIFGSMFQSVMDSALRREMGAHYDL